MHTHEYSTIDTHTAGMPTRVVVDGLDVPGERGSVHERRDRFAETMDDVRRFLVCEPRGHADMFAAVPLTPADPRADLGLFFMDADGYLDMCGHATIGAIMALVEDAHLDPADSIVIETPSGLVTTHPCVEDDGNVVSVTFENVPSAFVDTLTVHTGQHDAVDVDIVSAGNVCAIVDADAAGLTLPDSPANKVAASGTAVRDLLNEHGPFADPVSGRSLDVSLVQFTDASDPNRTAVVFGDGTVDRSPCGTGTSARMTLLGHRGELAVDEPFAHVGPTGESFSGRILDSRDDLHRTAVTGSAHVIGRHTFVRGATDPLDAFTFD